MADFKVRHFQRDAGAIGAFAWSDWRIIRNATADEAIALHRLCLGDAVETAGVDCRLIQEGDKDYAVN